MEEAKAAAYYEELTRKGDGAARFKQGLGFSATTSSVPCPPRPSPSSSSPFSNFIRASSPGKAEKQAQLETIQAKLRRPRRSPSPDLRCQGRERDVRARRRSTSRERRSERVSDRRSRSRDRRRSSRSYSSEEEDREERRRSRSGRRERYSSRRENRDLKRDHSKDERSSGRRISEEKSDKLDYPRLIEGYSQMTPAERIKAKMKLQLSQTAANDSTMAMSNGWERFDFNKNAPLDDDDDEIEVAGDDASLVKKIGSSFRFSAVQAKREEEIKVAHDEAMFGVSTPEPIFTESKGVDDDDDTKMANNEKQDNNLLISDKVLEKQQGSWRDRVGKFKSRYES